MSYKLLLKEEKDEDKINLSDNCCRLRGSVGLVDHEKNYLILVTPKGNLVRVKFTDKTRVIKLVPEKAEMKDIRVRSRSTVSISYETKDGENILKSIEYKGRAKKKKPK